jgi:hypothetical protein
VLLAGEVSARASVPGLKTTRDTLRGGRCQHTRQRTKLRRIRTSTTAERGTGPAKDRGDRRMGTTLGKGDGELAQSWQRDGGD